MVRTMGMGASSGDGPHMRKWREGTEHLRRDNRRDKVLLVLAVAGALIAAGVTVAFFALAASIR